MKDRRPCLEIELEISNIKKNINYIKKDIKSGIYTGEDLETLKKNLEYQKERLAEMQEKLANCD